MKHWKREYKKEDIWIHLQKAGKDAAHVPRFMSPVIGSDLIIISFSFQNKKQPPKLFVRYFNPCYPRIGELLAKIMQNKQKQMKELEESRESLIKLG